MSLDPSETATAHLRRLAREPRPTGSAAVSNARDYCAQVLTSAGFQVRERRFEYSAAVGSYGTPAGGLAALALVVAAAALSLGSHAASSFFVLVGGFALIALGGEWIARRGVLALPLLRRRGVNLEASFGGAAPGLWLVAHLDSKSQPIPLLARAGGIMLLALAALAAVAFASAGALGVHLRDPWKVIIAGAIVGALPVMGSVVGRSSAGAIDNASGVATVLSVAESLSAKTPVGILITDAEELGLAGARAWCAETEHTRAPVLNCDGVDDGGELTVMWTRPRARRLEDALRTAAQRWKTTLRVIPLVPGVLVDGVAFSDAGWDVVTLSRGSLGTLRRIHTRGDNLTHLDGTGIAAAAQVLGSAIEQLMES